jgi:hypothetical protein
MAGYKRIQERNKRVGDSQKERGGDVEAALCLIVECF